MTALRPTVALLAAAGLLAVAPAAPAKEITKVAVCGASACNTFTDKDLPTEKMHLLVDSGGETAPPDKASPWYRIKVTIGPVEGETGFKGETWTLAYVPAAGLFRSHGESGEVIWSTLLPGAQKLIRQMSHGLGHGLPASRLTGLDARPPAAQVSEVFTPADSAPATAPAADASTTPWGWLVLGLAAVVALAGGLGRWLRRRPVPAAG
jgi:hypothetical protein